MICDRDMHACTIISAKIRRHNVSVYPKHPITKSNPFELKAFLNLFFYTIPFGTITPVEKK